jgi:hypothetical protein
MQQYSHWHYIAGYTIVTVRHNWPVLIALAVALIAAWRLYREPSRKRVQWLYGWSLLVFTYEYIKHLGDELARPVVFLFTTDWAWMQPYGIFLVVLVPPPFLLALSLFLLARSLYLPFARTRNVHSTG